MVNDPEAAHAECRLGAISALVVTWLLRLLPRNPPIVFTGLNSSLVLCDQLAVLGFKRVLIVTDNFLGGSGILDGIKGKLSEGGVEFVAEGADMEIAGTLLSSELETVDRAGVPNLQLTIRTAIELRGGGRSIWSTTLFGRGRVPVEEGLGSAVNASLERLVRELLRDDYFLLELE